VAVLTSRFYNNLSYNWRDSDSIAAYYASDAVRACCACAERCAVWGVGALCGVCRVGVLGPVQGPLGERGVERMQRWWTAWGEVEVQELKLAIWPLTNAPAPAIAPTRCSTCATAGRSSRGGTRWRGTGTA